LFFSSAIITPKGTVCAGGTAGYTVFSANGQSLHTVASLYGVPAGIMPDGGFICYQPRGYYMLAFNEGGHLRWQIFTGAPYRLGVLPDSGGGWITVAGDIFGNLVFEHVDSEGNQSERVGFLIICWILIIRIFLI